MGRTTKYLLALNSLICGFFLLHSFVLGHFFTSPRLTGSHRTLRRFGVGFAFNLIAGVGARIHRPPQREYQENHPGALGNPYGCRSSQTRMG